MGITLDGSVTCVRPPASEDSSEERNTKASSEASSEERGQARERWADLLSDGEEEVSGCKKKKSAGESQAKGAQTFTKRPVATKVAPKPPAAAPRGHKKWESAVWTEVAQTSKWKVKDAAQDATGKNSAASSPARKPAASPTQKPWADDWSHESSTWDDEWASAWDEEWTPAGSERRSGYAGWSQQWAAPRNAGDGGRKLQCQFHIGIEEEPEFRVCRRLLGPAGKHMKAIAEKTGARLRLRGRGSRFREGPAWQESYDPLMLCVSALGRDSYDQAVQLVRDLLESIYQDFAPFKPSNPELKINLHEGAREGSGAGR